uniref:Gypsy retrotransposon integrase-like protein 1 n=1 Tax=Astyanax mexicanus TaxID=7994 RepID=A0A3B1IWP2_ASTMX
MQNIIRESESSFASPVVVVKKKSGAIRLCVDYRKLNSQTIKDAYALPNIEETFSALHGSRWFSVMDLKSGYYQVEVEEEDKHKTAFVTPMGFWEFNRLPQGVTNAPSTFQRVMEKCMGTMNLKEVLVFLDDLIVFSDTLEEHESRLMRVLTKLKDFGLKLSPEKCHFFRRSVRYLGHIVSEDGVETDPEKISALTTWPKPRNIRELKSFLGFTGYYRRFVKDYSKIARPLNDLTVGYIPQKRRSRGKPHQLVDQDSGGPLQEKWNEKCDEAFNTLIEKLTTAPILGFANPHLPYVLHTDASVQGLGAALYQQQDGQLRVIAYASRGLSYSEKRYPTHKLEFLAVKWAVTDKFFDYLYGAEFTIMTDNNPLTYVLTSAKLDAAGHRWLAALSTFNFSIRYRAGKRNQDADGLSRRPHAQLESDSSLQAEDDRVKQFLSRLIEDDQPVFPQEAVKAVCQIHLYKSNCVDNTPAIIECLAMNVDAIPTEYTCTELIPGSSTLPSMSQQDWISEQRNDPTINRVISLITSGKRVSYRAKQREDREVQLLLRVRDQLVLDNNVLYRRRMVRGEPSFQLVLPKTYRQIALDNLHDSMGHMGIDRTLDLVRTRFYWPHMQVEVEKKVRTCERCIRRKAAAERSAPLVNIRTSRPMELVCIDYLSLEPDRRGTKDILVISDHFTKYAVAVPTSDQKAKTVAKTLWNSFFHSLWIP